MLNSSGRLGGGVGGAIQNCGVYFQNSILKGGISRGLIEGERYFATCPCLGGTGRGITRKEL